MNSWHVLTVLVILDPAFIFIDIQRDNWKIYNFQFIYKVINSHKMKYYKKDTEHMVMFNKVKDINEYKILNLRLLYKLDIF